MHRYFPHTPAEIEEMLARCGMKELRDLYSDVPDELKLKAPYNLPAEMSETEVRGFFIFPIPPLSCLILFQSIPYSSVTVYSISRLRVTQHSPLIPCSTQIFCGNMDCSLLIVTYS